MININENESPHNELRQKSENPIKKTIQKHTHCNSMKTYFVAAK